MQRRASIATVVQRFGADPVFLPTTRARDMKETHVVDPDAAFGYAVRVHKPDMPFQIGFYQWLSHDPPQGKEVARLSLGKDDITPGAYQVVKLDPVTVTEDCWLWFSVKSWQTHLRVSERLYARGEPNRWDAYVSLKFQGPTYGGDEDADEVLVDPIIFVEHNGG